MPRKSGFRIRTKIALNIVLGKFANPMQVMVCEYCGSEKIKTLKEWDSKLENEIHWNSTTQCQKCGAKCTEKQIWTQE